jgi:hypothetical protein
MSNDPQQEEKTLKPVGFDGNKTKSSIGKQSEQEEKADPRMNHPHIKGAGTLFM